MALTVWRAGPARGPRRIEGVKPAPIGDWSLDVGRGPNGNPWAVYTSCTRGGCRPWGIDLRTGIRRSLGVGRGATRRSGAVASSSRATGRLYRATVGRPRSVRRLPMPRRGRTSSPPSCAGTASPTRPGSPARTRVSSSSGDQRLDEDVAPRRAVADGGAGEECTRLLASPTFSARGLSYLLAGSGEPSVCGRSHRTVLVTPFGRRPAPTGASGAVVAAGRTVVLRAAARQGERADRDRCAPRRRHGDVVGCEVRALELVD